MQILRVHSEAETELQHALQWYEQRRNGLGKEFLDEFRLCTRRISLNPLAFAAHPMYAGNAEIRRCVLSRFPYEIVFAVLGEFVMVLAVAHSHRWPLYWQARLGGVKV